MPSLTLISDLDNDLLFHVSSESIACQTVLFQKLLFLVFSVNFASLDIHAPLSLPHFPLLPLVCGHITSRRVQGRKSGISANAVPWVFDYASNILVLSMSSNFA